LPTSDSDVGVSDRSRWCHRDSLRLGLVRGREEGNDEGQIRSDAAENRSRRQAAPTHGVVQLVCVRDAVEGWRGFRFRGTTRGHFIPRGTCGVLRRSAGLGA
jgi:hypothetical protein